MKSGLNSMDNSRMKASGRNLVNSDMAELDAAREELVKAVKDGTIREGYSEDGTSSGDIELSQNIVSLMDDASMESQDSYHAPSVNISKLRPERSRNQTSTELNKGISKAKGMFINSAQNSNIRNANLESEGMSKHRRKKSRLKKLILSLLFVFLALVLLLGGAFTWYKAELRPVGADPADCNNHECYPFAIVEGERTKEIAANLETHGIIRSALAFKIYLATEGRDAKLRSGNYMLSRELSVPDLVAKLNRGSNAKTRNITFLPGDTLSSAKNTLMRLGYSEAEIDSAFSKQYAGELFAGRPANTTIEGYIYGDTYEVYVNSSVEQILTTKVFPEMEAFVKKRQLAEAFKRQGLSLYEGVTLASIINRESGNLPDEMPKVARVFLNRLQSNQPLGSDAVIAYRADQINPERDKSDMSYLGTIGCPWDSRHCKGLPPSPIATPNAASLQALANPDDNNYYYFVTGDDMKMYYAETEEEHIRNTKEYCKLRCKVL